jgi:hypothetical protein
MAKLTTTNRRAPEPKRESRYGSRLAINMLRQLEASTELCDACALDELKQKRAKPQDNIVWRYLETCRARSRGAERGFCAVLSDFIADASDGFVPDAEVYGKALKIEVPGGVSAAAENRRTWKSIQRITGEDYGPMPPDFGTPGWAKKQRDARKSAAAKESARK